jgi:hypothetical protein
MDENAPLQKVVVTLNPRLELVSFTDSLALSAPLTVDAALDLARELVRVAAHHQPAFGTLQQDETQDALSQAFTWIGLAKEALAKSRALAAGGGKPN